MEVSISGLFPKKKERNPNTNFLLSNQTQIIIVVNSMFDDSIAI